MEREVPRQLSRPRTQTAIVVAPNLQKGHLMKQLPCSRCSSPVSIAEKRIRNAWENRQGKLF